RAHGALPGVCVRAWQPVGLHAPGYRPLSARGISGRADRLAVALARRGGKPSKTHAEKSGVHRLRTALRWVSLTSRLLDMARGPGLSRMMNDEPTEGDHGRCRRAGTPAQEKDKAGAR